MNNFSLLCFIFLLILIIIIFTTNCFDFFTGLKTENYTPSIVRYLPCTKSQNNCPFPYTNNKLNDTCNNDVYTYQYANRKLLSPDKYLDLVKHLLNDLSIKKLNVTNLPDKLLSEKYYEGDPEYLSNFLNAKINKLITNKKYLQNNGPWKFEYFYASNPTIYYYEVNNNNNDELILSNFPNKFNLFKIIYTLGNPLRSSYTSCLAFITQINNELEIQYTGLVNNFEKLHKDNLNVIPSEALDFSFIDSIANYKFDQFGNSNSYSGINYIKEYREGKPVDIKADIPKEFKENNFHPQHLPPLFGNGICKYPPTYKNENGIIETVNSPPIFPGVHI
jgi:hypothetical protein